MHSQLIHYQNAVSSTRNLNQTLCLLPELMRNCVIIQTSNSLINEDLRTFYHMVINY
jgi:hypothetical protein